MSKIILGFDVSSESIGYSSLEIDGYNISLKEMSYIKPIKSDNIIFDLADTRDKLKEIIERIKPDYIAIEDIVKFMKGKSTAATITKLASFNRMVGLLSYDYLHFTPNYYNVLSIRHGIKIGKILPKKEQLPELVEKLLGINFSYELSKRGKIIEENYDKCDACCVALKFAFDFTGKTKKGKKKKK